MTKNVSVDSLLKSLDMIGLPEKFVRSLLPPWWDDSAASTDSGFAELELILSRQFGLDIKALLENKTADFSLPKTIKYKRSVLYDTGQLAASTSIALSCARIAAAAITIPQQRISDPNSLREYILSGLRGKWVSLKGVVMACWAHGIPVIYVEEFPENCKKMDGMVVGVRDRSVIVLSKQTRFSAWFLFILAHELGHISLGHVEQGEILVDAEMGEMSLSLMDADEDERAADEFAMALLGGDFVLPDNFLKANDPSQLAELAMGIGKAHQIDPGHLLLRQAYESGDWQLLITALKRLQGEIDGTDIIREGMIKYLNIHAIPEDNYRYLLRMAGMA